MKPVISVITVCYNEQAHIEETIKSVLSQTMQGIEFIVIDGASADGSVDIINRYKDRISYFISEKDTGIYDGMNKGLLKATGEYVLFLNGGDTLSSSDVLEKVFAVAPNADAYYGETLFTEEDGTPLGTRSEVSNQKLPARLNWKSLRYGMVVSHQSFIVKRSIAPQYSTHYRICSDVEWMIGCLRKSSVIVNTKLVISQFRTGGRSAQHRKKAWKERYTVLKNEYGFLPNLFNHAFIIARYIFSKKRF